LDVAQFDFDLPEENIAVRPVEPRDAARLLVIRPEGCEDRVMGDLPALLQPGDLMVFNDTRVIPARLFGYRGRARVEATLHKRLDDVRWAAFARPARRLRPGDVIAFADDFSARVESRDGGEVVLAFDRGGDELLAALDRCGVVPLPPYIASKRPIDETDERDYQTVFASEPGAVAAPTAGLHYTPRLLAALEKAGIGHCRLTLHVGAGTFLPVKAEDTDQHRMHSEWGRIDAATAARINECRARGGRIVAVGTTSLRLLESAAAADGTIGPYEGETDIFITPGYRFRAVDLLLTNFHLPRSTLFMLVSAFSGLERMKAAYAHAIAAGYRFYSYGDCCLLFPERK